MKKTGSMMLLGIVLLCSLRWPVSALPPREGESLVRVANLGGSAHAIAVDGDQAYVGLHRRVVIYDVSEPAIPVEIGATTVLSEEVRGIAISGPYAYVAAGRFYVYDLTNPTLPELRSSLPIAAQDVAVSGDYVYLAAGSSGLRILNVHNPDYPHEVGYYLASGDATAVVVDDGYAYLVAGRDGVCVLDIGEPTQPEYMCALWSHPDPEATLGRVNGICISDHVLYAAAVLRDPRQFLIYTADVSDPSAPREGTGYWLDFWIFCEAQGVAVGHGHVYGFGQVRGRVGPVSCIRHAVYVFDVGHFGLCENPTSWSCTAPIEGIAISGGGLCLAAGAEGWRSLAADSLAPTGNLRPPGALSRLAGCGWATAAGTVSVSWLNLQNLAAPVTLGTHDLTGPRQTILSASGTVTQTCLLLDDWDGGAGWQTLQIIDHSDPISPTVVGETDIWDDAYAGTYDDLAVTGDVALLWGRGPNLDVWQLGANPSRIGRHEFSFPPTTYEVHDVAVQGETAYCVGAHSPSESYTLSLIDISEPHDPQPIINHGWAGQAQHVAVRGQWACVGGKALEGEPQIWVWDVSDPIWPSMRGTCALPEALRDLAMMDSYAIASLADDQVVAIDLADPYHPTLAATYQSDGEPSGLLVCGRGIGVADGPAGLTILRLSPLLELHLPLVWR